MTDVVDDDTVRVGDAVPIPVQLTGATVPCVYCHQQMAADRFVYWSPAQRLVSADCGQCERRVTLTTKTWRRWSQICEPATT
jgi:uncharacterized CHY-type Zn-finger protein